MKYDALKKHTNQWVRIRPALQLYDESAVLVDTIEDPWWLFDVTGDSARLRNQASSYERQIGLDNIHHYVTDRQAGSQATGILVMSVQLLMFESNLLVEPVAPPGTPLAKFVPARSRETLYSTAARAAAAVALKARQREYAWSVEGINAARQAVRDFVAAFKTLEADLAMRGQEFPVRTKDGGGWGTLIGVCGWWLWVTWDQPASNVIDDAELTIRKFDGVPQFPGVISLGEGRQVGRETYGFGLVALDEARWTKSGSDRSYTSMELATKILTDLIERPNDRHR